MNMNRRNLLWKLLGAFLAIPLSLKCFGSKSEEDTIHVVSTVFTYSREQVIALARCYKSNSHAGIHQLSRAMTCFPYETTSSKSNWTMLRWMEIMESIHSVSNGKGAGMYSGFTEEWIREGLES
jgi:hypothetical protein